MPRNIKCCVCGKKNPHKLIMSYCYTSLPKEGELAYNICLPFCYSCATKKLNQEIQANIDFCKKHIKEGYPK